MVLQRRVWTGYKFTGKERDAESGLDYFGARYYASTMGRFMSSDLDNDLHDDPTAAPYANLNDPQTLNLYSYVRNNPTTLTDPDGHCWSWAQFLCNTGQRIRNEFTGYGFRTDAGVEQRLHDAHKWLRENTPLNSGKQEQLTDKGILKLYDATQAGKDSVIVDDGKGGKKINLLYLVPGRDVTGRVHGDLPDHVPDDWTREELEQARDELRESIKARNEQQARRGKTVTIANASVEKNSYCARLKKNWVEVDKRERLFYPELQQGSSGTTDSTFVGRLRFS